MKWVIVILILCGFAGWSFWLNYGSPHEVACFDDPYGSASYKMLSPEDCQKSKQEYAERYDRIQTAALKVGCPSNQGDGFGIHSATFYCENTPHKYMSNAEGEFIETKDSKACSPYYDRPMGEMPLRCLDYYGISKH